MIKVKIKKKIQYHNLGFKNRLKQKYSDSDPKTLYSFNYDTARLTFESQGLKYFIISLILQKSKMNLLSVTLYLRLRRYGMKAIK